MRVTSAAHSTGSAHKVTKQQIIDGWNDDHVAKTPVSESKLPPNAKKFYEKKIAGQSDDESISSFRVAGQLFYAMSDNNSGNGTTHFFNAMGKEVAQDFFTEG